MLMDDKGILCACYLITLFSSATGSDGMTQYSSFRLEMN
uniref:Uncharacterized protein n=1 Tax=Anguilla anguilla TaxID=7936 RepID=A0A0E9XY83_ANGAN